jgi:hypothetical protein
MQSESQRAYETVGSIIIIWYLFFCICCLFLVGCLLFNSACKSVKESLHNNKNSLILYYDSCSFLSTWNSVLGCTNTPEPTKFGMLILWDQEENIGRSKLWKSVLSLSPGEGGSCSSETKHDRRTTPKLFVSKRRTQKAHNPEICLRFDYRWRWFL